MSCWQEQETPTTRPLLPRLARRNLSDSLSTKVPQALLPVSAQNPSCPNNLVNNLQGSLRPLTLTQWEVCKLLLFSQKEEREDPHLRELCHPLRDQVGQELMWLSSSGPEVVLSNLLWDILTEEGLSQAWAITNSRGTPSYIRVHAIWMPPIWAFLRIH